MRSGRVVGILILSVTLSGCSGYAGSVENLCMKLEAFSSQLYVGGNGAKAIELQTDVFKAHDEVWRQDVPTKVSASTKAALEAFLNRAGNLSYDYDAVSAYRQECDRVLKALKADGV